MNKLLLIAALALLYFAAKSLPEVAEPIRSNRTARASFLLLLTIIFGLLIESCRYR
jgi:hypothetical protein